MTMERRREATTRRELLIASAGLPFISTSVARAEYEQRPPTEPHTKGSDLDLKTACRNMFASHQVAAFGEHFHVPAAREYSCLFAWDSGYHALALRHLDETLAEQELWALFRANTCGDGLLAHERPLPGTDARTALVTDWLGPIYRPDGRSWLIDPPVGAFATARMYLEGKTTSAGLLTLATESLEAVDRLRLLTPDGAPVLLHPLESGADVSPLFDALADTSSRRSLLADHKAFSVHVTESGYDLQKAMTTGHRFVVSDPIFCGWHLLAIEELVLAWRKAGDGAKAMRLEARAQSLAAAMIRDLWSPDLNLFVGYDHVGGRRLEVATLGGIIAAASRTMIRSGHARKIIEAHLKPETSRFWGPMGVAFNPLDHRPIDPKALLWRGDVVWGATQYWAFMVLARNGRTKSAGLAATQMGDLIAMSGFREFYSAVSGEGFGAGLQGGFTWPGLALDMIT